MTAREARNLRYDDWELRAAAPGRGGGQGSDRLRAPAGHGRRQLRGVGPGLLPGLPAPGADPRREAQPGREHRQLDPGQAPPQGLVLLAGPRGGPDLEHAVRLPRAHGRPGGPVDGLGRRGLRRGLPAAGPRQGRRHAHVGRRDLAHREQRPRGQRHRHRRRVRRLRAGGPVADRGPRRRARTSSSTTSRGPPSTGRTSSSTRPSATSRRGSARSRSRTCPRRPSPARRSSDPLRRSTSSCSSPSTASSSA